MSTKNILRRMVGLPVYPLMSKRLAAEIARERSEGDTIDIRDQLDMSLAENWQKIMEDLHHDPEWVEISKNLD